MMTATEVGTRWQDTMFWKWLNDHLIVMAAPIAVIIAAYFGPRYSLLGKIVEQTEALRKASDQRFVDQQSKNEKLDGELHLLRSEVLTARGEVIAVRNENTDLIRHNNELKLELAEFKGKYDALLEAHERLKSEHDTLRRQMNILHPETGESIG